MNSKELEVIFDKPQRVFSPGETLSGQVKVILASTITIRGILFSCKGVAHTGWEITRNNNNEKYEGDEEYFKIKYNLIGGSGHKMDLSPGEHVYLFTCVLPPVLPSSFEGVKGYVRYTVKATLDRPWAFDQKCEKSFTVISPLDLNLIPHLKESVTLSLEKYFCCLWCKSGLLAVEIYMPCSGYVSGQTIPITCVVDNASNVDVSSVVCSLVQKISFHSKTPSRETEVSHETISRKTYSTPICGTERKEFVEQIEVPSLPPSNLTNCTIIDLDYSIKVEIVVSGFHANMISNIPITIGTVPLSPLPNYAPSAPIHPSFAKPSSPDPVNIGWIAPSVSTTLNPNPYYLPPLDTVQQMNNQSANTSGEEGFRPLYPIYQFPNVPNAPNA